MQVTVVAWSGYGDRHHGVVARRMLCPGRVKAGEPPQRSAPVTADRVAIAAPWPTGWPRCRSRSSPGPDMVIDASVSLAPIASILGQGRVPTGAPLHRSAPETPTELRDPRLCRPRGQCTWQAPGDCRDQPCDDWDLHLLAGSPHGRGAFNPAHATERTHEAANLNDVARVGSAVTERISKARARSSASAAPSTRSISAPTNDRPPTDLQQTRRPAGPGKAASVRRRAQEGESFARATRSLDVRCAGPKRPRLDNDLLAEHPSASVPAGPHAARAAIRGKARPRRGKAAPKAECS